MTTGTFQFLNRSLGHYRARTLIITPNVTPMNKRPHLGCFHRLRRYKKTVHSLFEEISAADVLIVA